MQKVSKAKASEGVPTNTTATAFRVQRKITNKIVKEVWKLSDRFWVKLTKKLLNFGSTLRLSVDCT